MKESIIKKFGKSKMSVTTVQHCMLLTLLDVDFQSDPSMLHIEVTKESLIYIYYHSSKGEDTFHILIYGHVDLLDDLINEIADEVDLTLDEREYLIDLPNIEDNRPNTHITLLRSDHGCNN